MRPERLFGTVVGWLIGLGMVLFGLVGFTAINQATPLSSSSYLSAPTSATPTSTPTVSRTPVTTGGKGKSTGTTGKGKSTTTGQGAGKLSQTQLVTLGQSVITAHCTACHVVNGSGGQIGPNLDKVMAGQTNLPGMVPGGHPTQAAWLVSWITDPQKVWPQAIMPALGLSPQQVQAVVAYLTTKVK